MRPRIARAGAIAVLLALLTGRAVGAEEPSETLRLTRLGGGEPAAEFSVATPDGAALRLGDLRGKVVLLNFWATWCEPCLEEMPAMERLARTFRERGLAVLALSVDREGASVVRPFLKRHDLTFLVGLDPQQAVARLVPHLGPPLDHHPRPEGRSSVRRPGGAGMGRAGRPCLVRRSPEAKPLIPAG